MRRSCELHQQQHILCHMLLPCSWEEPRLPQKPSRCPGILATHLCIACHPAAEVTIAHAHASDNEGSWLVSSCCHVPFFKPASPCSAGHFQTAAEAEAAWRARHKWAAARVAQLLTDLPIRPPLAAASAFLDLSCLRVALPLDIDGAARPYPDFRAPFLTVLSNVLLLVRDNRAFARQGR